MSTTYVTQDCVIQRARLSGLGTGNIPDQYTVLWERAFTDDNYTVAVTLECPAAVGTTGAVLYTVKKLADHSGIIVTATIPGGDAYTIHAVAIHDKD